MGSKIDFEKEHESGAFYCECGGRFCQDNIHLYTDCTTDRDGNMSKEWFVVIGYDGGEVYLSKKSAYELSKKLIDFAVEAERKEHEIILGGD